MNTPTHALLNLTLLMRGRPGVGALWIVAGAIGPDAPIFALYAVSRWRWRQPSEQIWSSTYFEPGWQMLADTAHSVPLALVVLIVGWRSRSVGLKLFAWSLLLHSVLDFPFHTDDAHRHFFPLSQYRFDSPISYWDPSRHGRVVALVETLGGIGLCAYWFQRARRALARVTSAVLAAVYAVGAFMLVRSVVDFPWLARLFGAG
jgi:hypothetical protein